MRLSTLALGAFMAPTVEAIFGWGGCPDIPELDDKQDETAIDEFGRVTYANSVDL
jgi:hypothetical protein